MAGQSRRRVAASGCCGGSAVYLGGCRVRFEWPCGHYRTEDLSGSHRPLARRIPSEEGVRFMVKRWAAGVYLGKCPTCHRMARKP